MTRFPSDVRAIEVHVAELRQLFNSMDPSPFTGRDLDPAAEEFIVATMRELPRERPLGLLIRGRASQPVGGRERLRIDSPSVRPALGDARAHRRYLTCERSAQLG
jgi:hypothetical protein